jgi:hypothetical protein
MLGLGKENTREKKKEIKTTGKKKGGGERKAITRG